MSNQNPLFIGQGVIKAILGLISEKNLLITAGSIFISKTSNIGN
jgi:hypothetical protein